MFVVHTLIIPTTDTAINAIEFLIYTDPENGVIKSKVSLEIDLLSV